MYKIIYKCIYTVLGFVTLLLNRFKNWSVQHSHQSNVGMPAYLHKTPVCANCAMRPVTPERADNPAALLCLLPSKLDNDPPRLRETVGCFVTWVAETVS